MLNIFIYFLYIAVQTCQHDSPDYSSCLRLAVQEAWPNFLPGIRNGVLIIFLFKLVKIFKFANKFTFIII